MAGLTTVCLPYEFWIKQIRREQPFTFTRYGDGELNALFWTSRKKGGGRTKNGDGHSLRIPEMRKDMERSILEPGPDPDPPYYRTLWMDDGCQPMERLARERLPKLAGHLTWYNALAIHFKNIIGQNWSYFQAMRNLKMPLVVIGPRHLRTLSEVGCFDYDWFVEVPYHSAYHARERIVEEALQCPDPCYYSIHAGPPAPVIAWMLWKERGKTCVINDLGSILDGYCGAKTRKFWKKRATPAIMNANLRGKV